MYFRFLACHEKEEAEENKYGYIGNKVKWKKSLDRKSYEYFKILCHPVQLQPNKGTTISINMAAINQILQPLTKDHIVSNSSHAPRKNRKQRKQRRTQKQWIAK